MLIKEIVDDDGRQKNNAGHNATTKVLVVFVRITAVNHIEFTRAQFSHLGWLSSNLLGLVAFTFAKI
jgi:hypothetical protein